MAFGETLGSVHKYINYISNEMAFGETLGSVHKSIVFAWVTPDLLLYPWIKRNYCKLVCIKKLGFFWAKIMILTILPRKYKLILRINKYTFLSPINPFTPVVPTGTTIFSIFYNLWWWWWVGCLLGLYYIFKVLIYAYHIVKFHDTMKGCSTLPENTGSAFPNGWRKEGHRRSTSWVCWKWLLMLTGTILDASWSCPRCLLLLLMR